MASCFALSFSAILIHDFALKKALYGSG